MSIKAFLESRIKPGMVVIDAGAYIGTYTTFFNKLIYPQGKVFAFEPEKENFNKLYINTNSDSCIECIKSALSNYYGKGYLCLLPPSEGYFMVDVTGFEKYINEFSIIDVTYIDKFCRDNKIEKVDLIKIDVEGQDLQVLEGAINTIDNNKNIIIIVEIHHQNNLQALSTNKSGIIGVNYKNRFPYNKEKIYKFLKSREFKLYDHTYKNITDDLISLTPSILEIVAVKENK